MKSKIEIMCDAYLQKLDDSIYSVTWDQRETFIDWLAQTYYYVRHSTRVLALAAVRFNDQNFLHHKQMIHHADHEMGHERIACHDLKQLGIDLTDIPEKAATRRIYHSIYFQLQYESPLCIYGYVYFLEMLSLRYGMHVRKSADAFYKEMGKKESYLKVHTDNDEDHIGDYIQALRSFSGEEEKYVLSALEQVFVNYEGMIRALAKSKDHQLQVGVAA